MAKVPFESGYLDTRALEHEYTYNGDGTLATDTAIYTDGSRWVKTYGYENGRVVAESIWMRQWH